MRVCDLCGKELSNWIRIDGKKHNICNRKYCLECSPFKTHNTKKLGIVRKNNKICQCGRKKSRVSERCGYCDLQQRPFKVPLSELKSTSAIRKRLMITKGRHCEKCHLSEWLGEPITLELHHIDGDSDNNNLSNLMLICPNCHSMTNNYRAKNIGNGSKRSSYRKSIYNRI